jgi:predicted histidine transporter YuiF (NhaC family)
MILMGLFFICLILPVPYGKVIAKTILQKLTIPATVYGVIALVIGLIVSMVISVYPLSTEYYQCKSTSIVSSRSPYAKTKEMCKQRAYISTNEEERSSGIPEKDRLESPEQ